MMTVDEKDIAIDFVDGYVKIGDIVCWECVWLLELSPFTSLRLGNEVGNLRTQRRNHWKIGSKVNVTKWLLQFTILEALDATMGGQAPIIWQQWNFA
mmetsp:Transcript_11588/g.17722  ORF Transcript_11588/g.17722 Transcript_11588/m.17722 type:complete len:97 (+) Transcript_11588:333-623(+)